MEPDPGRRKDLPLLIIKTGTAIHHVPGKGDFEQWIVERMGVGVESVRVCRIDEGEPLPNWEEFCGAVITGSAVMVTQRLAWSEKCVTWLRRAVSAQFPLLGICFGHQLLAHALGGVVESDPRGREIGSIEVCLEPEAERDPIFRRFPRAFVTQATHKESVIELPPGALHLGSSKHTRNHIFRVGKTAWGVQFHPEFDADVMRAFLRARREALAQEGLNPDQLHDEVRTGPWASAVLSGFASVLARTSHQGSKRKA